MKDKQFDIKIAIHKTVVVVFYIFLRRIITSKTREAFVFSLPFFILERIASSIPLQFYRALLYHSVTVARWTRLTGRAG